MRAQHQARTHTRPHTHARTIIYQVYWCIYCNLFYKCYGIYHFAGKKAYSCLNKVLLLIIGISFFFHHLIIAIPEATRNIFNDCVASYHHHPHTTPRTDSQRERFQPTIIYIFKFLTLRLLVYLLSLAFLFCYIYSALQNAYLLRIAPIFILLL